MIIHVVAVLCAHVVSDHVALAASAFALDLHEDVAELVHGAVMTLLHIASQPGDESVAPDGAYPPICPVKPARSK